MWGSTHRLRIVGYSRSAGIAKSRRNSQLDGQFQSSIELMNSATRSIDRSNRARWLGWAGLSADSCQKKNNVERRCGPQRTCNFNRDEPQLLAVVCVAQQHDDAPPTSNTPQSSHHGRNIPLSIDPQPPQPRIRRAPPAPAPASASINGSSHHVRHRRHSRPRHALLHIPG